MPLTEIIFTDDDDALGGGPSKPGPLIVAPTGSGTLITFGAPAPAPPPSPFNIISVTAGSLTTAGPSITAYGFDATGGTTNPPPVITISPTINNTGEIFSLSEWHLTLPGDSYSPCGAPPYTGPIDVVTVSLISTDFVTPIPQNFFTSITINGHTFATASADTFCQNGAQSTWNWLSPGFGFVVGITYPVSYT